MVELNKEEQYLVIQALCSLSLKYPETNTMDNCDALLRKICTENHGTTEGEGIHARSS